MIKSISAYANYFAGIRRRTLTYSRAIPPDRIDWSPSERAFTCGDLVRHLAAIERMYVTAIVTGQWHYTGHEKGQHNTLQEVIAFLESTHQDVLSMLETLEDSRLLELVPPLVPDTRPVKAWRWLMMMVEHEVHHRSELASYLTMMGVEPPQIFGVSMEEVREYAPDDPP